MTKTRQDDTSIEIYHDDSAQIIEYNHGGGPAYTPIFDLDNPSSRYLVEKFGDLLSGSSLILRSIRRIGLDLDNSPLVDGDANVVSLKWEA